jgi:hypothetical protein
MKILFFKKYSLNIKLLSDDQFQVQFMEGHINEIYDI